MNRIEIEIKLNRDRAWLLERLGEMPIDELSAPRTFSEHDPESQWSFADHFVHTSLIEQNWNAMFRRHVGGDQGLEPRLRSDGTPQSMEKIMASIHGWTEEWKAEHTGKPFIELVRIGQAIRADTLALLAELSDADLESKIPGAPWADGTVGGIMAANADHGRMHYGWAEEDPSPPHTPTDTRPARRSAGCAHEWLSGRVRVIGGRRVVVREAGPVPSSPFTTQTRPAGLVLTPGASADRDHHTLVAIDEALADLPVLRLTLGTNRVPSAVKKIIAASAEFADELGVPLDRLAYGGRSFGGRSCSVAVAEGLPAAALVLLSYPLHPPGKPDKLRVEHFADITVPTLFVSGRKDPFGTPDEFGQHVPSIPGPTTVEWVDGNHAPKNDAPVIDHVRRFLAR